MTEKGSYERLGGIFVIAAMVDHFSNALVAVHNTGPRYRGHPGRTQWLTHLAPTRS